MNQSTNKFCLLIHLENKTPMKIDVVDAVTVGLDPRNDLVLTGKKINNQHLIFELKEENLALHYLGNTNQTYLNSLPLEENKTYILEPGDKIRLTGAEIIIQCELVDVHQSQVIKPIIFNSKNEITSPSIADSVAIANKETPFELLKKEIYVPPSSGPEKIKETPNRDSFLMLWPVKLYSMIVDAFITYLVLVILLPLIYVDRFAISIFNYFSSLIFPTYTHSFFSFLVAWYLLSFSQTLIFGSTLGQTLLGLRNNQDTTFGRLILFRLKTFVYSLFLFPSQNTVKNTLLFKGIRKIGMIVILVFILATPFMLPAPYNSNLTLIGNTVTGVKELHSRTIMSYSKDLEMSLSTELPFRYYLLPTITNPSRRAFELIDLKSDENIIVSEVDDQSYESIEEKLKYGNPFYSTLQRSSLLENSLKEKKTLIQTILLLSPVHLVQDLKILGPFFGSALLVKKFLLNAHLQNDMVLKSYQPSTPLMFLSSPDQDFFYLFTHDRIRNFFVDSKSKGNLVTVFEQAIFTKLTQDTENSIKPNNQNVTILEAQDAFLHGDEQTFLTYYVAIANSLTNVKIIHAENDYTDSAKLAVIKNIDGVLKFIKNRNVYKSFNDIKNQLAPMEKPGEKR